MHDRERDLKTVFDETAGADEHGDHTLARNSARHEM